MQNQNQKHAHIQHKQQYTHHSHHNHRIHIGYQDNLMDRPRTTTCLHTPHKPCSKSERNLIILHFNIKGMKKKSNCLFTTHADIITIQETKLTPKAKTQEVHNFTTVRTDKHRAKGGLITLSTTDMPSTNVYNTELQMIEVHINNTKHITIANIYIPPRNSISMHYKTIDTDIQHCIQHITDIPHTVLTGDVNRHSTLWHSYTDDHRGQLIADVISNSYNITLTTDIPTRYHPLYNQTSWATQHALSSDHLPIITTIDMTTNYYKPNEHLQIIRHITGYILTKTQHCTPYGNAPKDSGSYPIPKAHIQHIQSQHLSKRTQTFKNNISTHRNRMG